ncbi:hypothetical protein N7447_003812 [Penicillium robsamsonii]|uniref:uncharacterized protein n=1 Tax=Penicillium robsamsonii TaxID=1792511 RepID=UPI0025465CD3|nr:uncharacterized protein N7447_003812 [Penicillium robsamsonii]KAJ5827049.1 hypothetical protein N7447_003812 [Penicillium robsamsonii]
MCKRAELGVMGKEEEGRTVSPGPDEGFYNLPRGVFFPVDAPILMEANVMARIAKAPKEPLDQSGHIDSHPSLCTPNPRAPLHVCLRICPPICLLDRLDPAQMGKKDSMRLAEDASLPPLGFPLSSGGLVQNWSRSTPLFLV